MSNGSGTYDPSSVELGILELWEKGRYAHAESDRAGKSYSIVIPPPNVTGALHLGHALNNTLQDIVIRHKRMCGFNACWLPGTDHAGIATQAVVEKRLRQEEKLTRHQLGREGLVKRIWDWKEDYNGRILTQIRRMGCSCDWERTRFTLDEVCARAVYETFFRFFKDGLIYRGLRLVNWDTQLQTAVADDEIVHETVKGHLWHYRYPILRADEAVLPSGDTATGAVWDLAPATVEAALQRARSENAKLGEDYLVIATTRPETMLGDTALAVHPEDERYRHLIGGHVLLPLQNRAIPVIGDGLLVKREFGTGCVKVTPAHDPNDYACGQRNSLEMINILAVDGQINQNGGAYAGLDRYDARKKVVADLETLGLMEKIEPYETEVGHSDRSKTPIEPLLSEQWFVRMEKLADAAIRVVQEGRIQFFPERFAKSYLDWLGEKRDWCISRQLWWGHRIPVWRKRFEDEPSGDEIQESLGAGEFLPVDGRGAEVFAAPGRTIAYQKQVKEDGVWLYVCAAPGEKPFTDSIEKRGYVQDDDVLDTWFSSALWPHSTFGWPNATADLKHFYPTNVLSTAREIISLWVARMVMTGLYNMGDIPFHHVFIHPTIQDGLGRRMSKSLGNGVDPLDLIELYGADAMRFTLASLTGETQDIRIPVKAIKLADGRSVNSSERFELGRNFCNKLWQAVSGFVLANLDGYLPRPLTTDDLAIEDRWILSRLGGCIAEVDRRLERYEFSDITNALYAFFWNDFCDWYVELVKPRLAERDASGTLAPRTDASAAVARQVLVWVADQVLRLLHPVAPFITEALWQKLNDAAPDRGVQTVQRREGVLMVAAWPDAAAYAREEAVERELDVLQTAIRGLRDIRARINVIRAASKESALRSLPHGVIRADAETSLRLKERAGVIQRLGQCEELEIGPRASKPPQAAGAVFPGLEVYVPLSGLADLELERKRLRKQRDELTGLVERLEHKLADGNFTEKAPADVVARERDRLGEMKGRLETIARHLAELDS